MNYSKHNTSKKRAAITSKKVKKRRRKAVQILKISLLVCLAIGLLGLFTVGMLFKRIIDTAPKLTVDDIKPSAYTTTVYANDGQTVLSTFVDAGSNRIFASIDQIPENMQNAFIAIEDARFREHNGIDKKGILRAGITGILSGGDFSQGASTITQQLIKNCIFPDFIKENMWQKIQRKVQEIYLAVEIEKEVGDKDIILENYLNMINLGQNTLGVQTASKRYFGKDVSELNLSECATIAAITQSPEYLNPISNPEANNKRRKKVLKNMLDQGYISQEEHDDAVKDDVYSRIQVSNTEYTESLSVNSYFVDEVAKAVMDDLMNELGYTKEQARHAVYSGGLKIISTQDVRMQQICEEELNNDENYPDTIKWAVTGAISIIHVDESQKHYDHNGFKKYVTNKYNNKYGESGALFDSKEDAQAMVDEYIESLKTSENDTALTDITIAPQPQASFVVMDQYTGQVKAIVGGRGEKTSSMSLNRATQSTRQPGSCFKVLSTFIPALELNEDTLATTILDAPFKYSGTSGKEVSNWWGDYYKGNLSIRDCITQSANVCSVKKLTEIKPRVGYEYLVEKFHFTTLSEKGDVYQSLALGGITNGVYNLEITAAYASIANDGVYTEPIFYTQILDHNGNLLYEKTPETHVAMSENTAALITNAMIDVIESSEGTGKTARMSNMQVAGKTGTSTNSENESNDLWLCAYTPYLTASIWTGFDDTHSLKGYNQSYHNRLWKQIMTRIHEGYESKTFELPNTIEKKTVCTETGKLASETCIQKYTEYFAPETGPSEVCPGHAVETPEAPADGTTNPETPTGTTGNAGNANTGAAGTSPTPQAE